VASAEFGDVPRARRLSERAPPGAVSLGAGQIHAERRCQPVSNLRQNFVPLTGSRQFTARARNCSDVINRIARTGGERVQGGNRLGSDRPKRHLALQRPL
jgi:hypothetical protein